MFKWYRNSAIAYAFLEDYPSPKMEKTALTTAAVGFGHSRWFTRGWTLQELIAPPRLEFYNKTWEKIAEKTAVAKQLAVITGVDAFVLDGSGPLQQVSVGRRLSWCVFGDPKYRKIRSPCPTKAFTSPLSSRVFANLGLLETL
ncbi:hypothetical protein ACHAPE_002080 [Trichoderma viride]